MRNTAAQIERYDQQILELQANLDRLQCMRRVAAAQLRHEATLVPSCVDEDEVRADDESALAARLADLQEKLARQRESGAGAKSPEVAAPTQSRPSSDLVAPAPEDLPPTDAETLLHDYRKDLRETPTLEGAVAVMNRAVAVMNRAVADAALSADQKADLQKLLHERKEALMPRNRARREPLGRVTDDAVVREEGHP